MVFSRFTRLWLCQSIKIVLKKKFQKFITNYFEQRKQLVSAFVLVDIRHEPQPIDLDFMSYLGESMIPFSIVFTKADKLKPKAIERHVQIYCQKLLRNLGRRSTLFYYFIQQAI